jgi:DNA repair protein RecO (recombination protein O)
VQLETEAIVCAIRNHGEHGAVVRLLTPQHGLIAAYVRGARGRRMSPILIPGNLVSAALRARSDNQLPQATVELSRSRAAILAEPLAAAAADWISGLTASALPERHAYPTIYQGISAFFEALESAPSAKGWALGLVRLELLILAELGYGGRPGRLPAAISSGESASWSDILDGLSFSAAVLEREVLGTLPMALRDSRMRLSERLSRAAGHALPAAESDPTSSR